MAKCSCSGSACSCSVVQGAGIVVSGVGSASNPFTISVAPTPGSITVTDTTLDLGSLTPSAVSRIVLQSSVTTVTLPATGAKLDLLFTQDGVGGRTVAWPAAVIWPGGTDPVLTATANATDWITLIQAGGVWAGVRIGTNLT